MVAEVAPNWVVPSSPVPPSVVIEVPKSKFIAWPAAAPPLKSNPPEARGFVIALSTSRAPLLSKSSVPCACISVLPLAESAPLTPANHSHELPVGASVSFLK